MGNEVVSKKTVAQFVHDAVEMEAAIYTLDKMKEKCKQEKLDVIEESENSYNYALEMLEIAEQDLKKTEENGYISPIQEPQKTNSSPGCSGCIIAPLIALGLVIASVLVFCIVTSVSGNNSEFEYGEYGDEFTVLFFILSIIIYLAWVFIFKISDKKDNAKAMKKFEQELQKGYEDFNIAKKAELVECHNEVRRCESIVEKEKQRKNLAHEKAELIDLQIKDIINKRNKINSNLANFYSYGIIPPDYRTFDCVMMLDQIFRNDLADNMRDAILLYEDRVFKGTVVKGIDKICSMLGHLSSEMSAISLRLDMINSSVVQMGDDLSRANQRLMQNQRELIEESIKNRTATEDLINETKLGRYTNEKLLESNEILVKYERDRRLGII